jgi:hypothetical protein
MASHVFLVRDEAVEDEDSFDRTEEADEPVKPVLVVSSEARGVVKEDIVVIVVVGRLD